VLADRCGIPATARAVSANVTVTGPSAAGDLRFYPAAQGLPGASVINFTPGQTRANNAIVMLNADHALAVRDDQPSGATIQLILDVNGYFE
jgi:hypothetical protein